MPGNLSIFLLLAAGFLGLTLCHLTRYGAQTWEGTRLVFWTGLAGTLLAAASLVISHFLLKLPFGWGRNLEGWVHAVAPWPYAGTIIGAFLLGIAISLGVNWRLTRERALYLSGEWWGSDLFRFLRETTATEDELRLFLWRIYVGATTGEVAGLFDQDFAVERGSPKKVICVTLDDRKVYVGLMIQSPRLTPGQGFFMLLPRASGYREEKTLGVVLTTDYAPLLRELVSIGAHGYLRPEDLQVLLPLNRVVSARVFDEDVYQRFLTLGPSP